MVPVRAFRVAYTGESWAGSCTPIEMQETCSDLLEKGGGENTAEAGRRTGAAGCRAGKSYRAFATSLAVDATA